VRRDAATSENLTALFNSLVSGDMCSRATSTSSSPALPARRNQMASHGQGSTVREVREELADASIAAAATAITFLAHYLP
jgi:hypothetical protein